MPLYALSRRRRGPCNGTISVSHCDAGFCKGNFGIVGYFGSLQYFEKLGFDTSESERGSTSKKERGHRNYSGNFFSALSTELRTLRMKY